MNQYIELLKQYDKVVIYGAGKIGITTLNILNEYGMKDKILGFAITENNPNTRMVNGMEVKSIYDYAAYYDKAMFLCAVTDEKVDELLRKVEELHIKHYLKATKIYVQDYKKDMSQAEMQKLYRAYIEQEKGNREISPCEQVTHITYSVGGNAGDTMLSQCVRKTLGFGVWEIEQITNKVSEELILAINSRRALVIGGGGLFLPDTNANMVSGWQWAISNEQLKQINVPIFVFAVGYNYFRGQEETQIFKDSITCLVEHAAFIGLRNRGSVRKVQNLVQEDDQAKIVYQPCPTTLINRIYKVDKKKNTRKIGLNIAFDREDLRYGNKKIEILEQIAKAAKEINMRGYSIIYIAHCDTDLRFLGYLDDEEVNYEVRVISDALPDMIINCYEDIELMIGMRGHAQMIPFGVGCRILTLGTHDKMQWFLEDVHALDWYVDLNKDTDYLATEILTKFTDINIKGARDTDKRLSDEQQHLWEITCTNLRAISQHCR